MKLRRLYSQQPDGSTDAGGGGGGTAAPVPDPNAAPTPTPETVTITKAEHDTFQQNAGKLDYLEKQGGQFGAAAPAAPAPPAGPSVTDQFATLNEGIKSLDVKIDEAVVAGKPVSVLLQQRGALESNKTRLVIREEDLKPIRDVSLSAIEHLTGMSEKSQMPHLVITEVKSAFDDFLSNLTPTQRSNPKVREGAYNMAIGKNVDAIVVAEQEKVNRAGAGGAQDLGSQAGRQTAAAAGSGGGVVPDVKTILSSENLAAIRAKGQTPDQYYQALGYKDWEDHYTQNKDHYEEGEAA